MGSRFEGPRSARPASVLTIVGLVVAAGVLPVSAQDLPRAAPEEVGFSAERLERVTDVFEGFAADRRIAGGVGFVARDGKVVYERAWGMRDVEAGDAAQVDDIYRIFSMTKPVTSVAVMILWEEGHFLLDDPVGDYLPELADLPVAVLAEAASPDDIPTEEARRPMTIQDLLRHTSGLTYGSFSNTVVDQRYREAVSPAQTLEEMVAEMGKIPLAYQPGTRWNYSLSTDVLGRLVEVVSGRSLPDFFRERIFEPLGMRDTGFWIDPDDRDRFVAFYGHQGEDGALTRSDAEPPMERPSRPSGGGGLVSTARDYARFAQMLLNGGELNGTRILGRKTVELMTVDHLPEGVPTSFLRPGWGFGLGFTVKNQPGLDGMPGSAGSFYWYGIGGTSFWVDPAEEMIGVFMVQIRPNRDVRFRDAFKALVYQALE